MSPTCPACSSTENLSVGTKYLGPVVTSDFLVLQNTGLAPCCCKKCGLVFESMGVRNFSSQFYAETFRPKPMMRVYGNVGSTPRPNKANRLISEIFSDLPADGSLLEVGAGKGGFLSEFSERHPRWKLAAIEPSILFESLALAVPQAKLHHGGYETSDCPFDSQDLIVSLGVIEHVDNPLLFMMWIADRLKMGGRAFLEAPNFSNHPSDLYCADHLSCLTPDTMIAFAEHAGFEILDWRDLGVPMYFAFRKTGVRKELISTFEQNQIIAKSNESLAGAMIESVARARSAAQQQQEKFGIYGLAIPGLFAPIYLGFSPTDIEAYIDDNEAMWGTRVHDRPIVGPGAIAEKKIRHLALSMSPQYTAAVRERLSSADVILYD
jgi:SAM-dependent methyltransferase